VVAAGVVITTTIGGTIAVIGHEETIAAAAEAGGTGTGSGIIGPRPEVRIATVEVVR